MQQLVQNELYQELLRYQYLALMPNLSAFLRNCLITALKFAKGNMISAGVRLWQGRKINKENFKCVFSAIRLLKNCRKMKNMLLWI